MPLRTVPVPVITEAIAPQVCIAGETGNCSVPAANATLAMENGFVEDGPRHRPAFDSPVRKEGFGEVFTSPRGRFRSAKPNPLG
jgi:hypothetical protein